MPRTSLAAASPAAGPNEERIQVPTLIGEVGLKTRSMLRNRAGRPRSEIRRGGLTDTPASAASRAFLARASLPLKRATRARSADAPARPPAKKYAGISQVQVGSLRTGRP